MVEVERVCSVSSCGEIQMISCYKQRLPYECSAPCNETLECGHKCQGTCGKWLVYQSTIMYLFCRCVGAKNNTCDSGIVGLFIMDN